MLQELHVHNLAIAEHIEIEFSRGFNVLTGETGAGKSIIIDAVSLLIGGRAQAELVRDGAESCRVEALFDISALPELRAQLEALDLAAGDELLITREVTAAGRSRCRINGRLTTVATLAEIGRLLVDIHGQHAHQSLLNPENHLAWLDAAAGAEVAQLKKEVQELWQRWHSMAQRLARWNEEVRERARRRDLLQFQVEEIDEAGLVPGEDELLREERQRLANAERLYEHIVRAYALIEQGNRTSGGGILDLIGEAEHALVEAVQWDKELQGVLELIQSASTQLQEAGHELRRRSEGIDANPDRLAEVESRLALIARLARKYGETVDQILAFRDACARELEQEDADEHARERLEVELEQVAADLTERALRLSELRRQAAAALARQVEAELQELAMEGARFAVEISRVPADASETGLWIDGEKVRCTKRGIDRVEFLFSANPGERLRPLARVASGGELSRLMLAIKGLLARHDRVPTLIFDEVDTGIGGRTASAVAERIARIAQSHQVLVVTHLAQIASAAHRHFLVEKVIERDRAQTRVRHLEAGQRTAEIARMLDGSTDETTLKRAEELLAQSTAVHPKKVG